MSFSEDGLQIQLVEFFRRFIKPEVAQIWSVPNGGKRNVLEAIRLKDAGATSGVPDLMIVYGDGKIYWVEVKRPANPILKQKAGTLSKTQKDIHTFLKEKGHEVTVIDNINDFHDLLKAIKLL